MTQQHTPLRSGMTAIAAVLALSSTAAFAQTADQAPGDPAAPVIAAPPPPAAEAPVTVAPAAPANASPMVAATPDVAPAPAPATPAPVTSAAAPMATRSTPVIHTPEAAAAEQASRPAQRTVTRTTATSRSSITTRSVTPPAAEPAARAPAPEAAPAPVLKPATPPAPAATATTRTTTQTATDNTLPIAGAIGLGIIALGAGAWMFSRRRRDDEEELVVAAEPTESTIVTPVTRPVYAAAPEAATAVPRTPVLAREESGELMTLPNGFDLSPFGRHVRAAYRGPTPDNPSHSLKRRLARARFFDQREREAIASGAAVAEPAPMAARTAKAPAAVQDEGQIVVRPGFRRPSRFFGTAFQR